MISFERIPNKKRKQPTFGSLAPGEVFEWCSDLYIKASLGEDVDIDNEDVDDCSPTHRRPFAICLRTGLIRPAITPEAIVEPKDITIQY